MWQHDGGNMQLCISTRYKQTHEGNHRTMWDNMKHVYINAVRLDDFVQSMRGGNWCADYFREFDIIK
jgi:hypothetical protein